jgi:hypothetical protein
VNHQAMTRFDLPTDQTARAEGARNFAAECRDAERAAIARAEAAEQRVAPLERQVRELSAIPPVDYVAGTSTCGPEWDPLDPMPAAATGADIAALPPALEGITANSTIEQFSQFEANLMNALENTVASHMVCFHLQVRPIDVGYLILLALAVAAPQ